MRPSARGKRAAMYALFWAAVGVVLGSQTLLVYSASGGGARPSLVYAVTLAYWAPWGLAGLLVLAAARRWRLHGPAWYRLVPAHLALNAVVAFGVIGLYRLLRVSMGYPPRVTLAVDYLRTLNTAVLVYWGLVALVEFRARQERLRRRERETVELAGRLRDAQLRALRAQLRPHFLFNTLHAIQAHVRDDPERADDMVAALADLLRRSLRDDIAAEVPLQEEMDFVRRYLDLQRLRLGTRLDVMLAIDPGSTSACVPFLILQPLVENAIEHGIEPCSGQGQIAVRCGVEGGALVLAVEDNGAGAASRPGVEGTRPIGLANTRERLARLYGGRASLRVEPRTDGGTRAEVRLPLRSAGAVAAPDELR